MTQEQANAIAEREYPQSWGPFQGGISIDHNHRVRKAYAKALMDMNPLIEAVESEIRSLNQEMSYHGFPHIVSSRRRLLQDALAKLTKSIEP